MSRPILLLFFLVCLCKSAFVISQKSFSININKNVGLPSPTVYDFVQDKQGFIWIASNMGLTRYDGFEFITYTSPDQTSPPGSSIYKDRFGRIWYQNFDGYLYYVKEEKMNALPNQNRPGEYVPFGVINDYLMVVQQKGVDVFNLKTLEFIKTIKVSTENVLSSTVLNNSFYFLGQNKLHKLDINFNLTATDYFLDHDIKVNRIDNDGKELFLTYKNREEHILYFFDQNLNYKRTITLPSKGWILTQQFYNNLYWLYTNRGFVVYDKNWKQVMSNELMDLETDISKCLMDKNGHYWFSSLRNGLYLVTDFNNKIYSFPDNVFRHIVKKKNGYLVSTNQGQIIELDKNFKEVDKWIDRGGDVQVLHFKYDEESDLLFYITTLGLHIFHHKKEVFFQDIAAKSIMKLDHKYFAITTSGSVLLLKNPIYKFKDDKTSIWDGLFNKNTLTENLDIAPLLSNVRAKSLNFYGDSKKFIVTSNVGMLLFDTKGNSEFKVEDKPFFANDIFTYNQKIYLLDNHGNLYVVYRSGKKMLLNNEIGIPINAIKFIKRYGNTLYIVCPNRVFEFDMTNSMSKTLSFNTNLMVITDLERTNDELLILSGSNIVSINLNNKSIQNNNPDFYFNSIYVQNEKVNATDLMNLKYDQNSIRVTYSLLDYGSNVEPIVSYRLNKGDWVVQPAGSREILLMSLSSGKYSLEVKMNNQVQEKKLFFNIDYPFYLKGWFIATIIFSVVFITSSIALRRTFLMRKKIRLLNERILLENQLRTSMLTSIKAQMNPHFFYNALNTIQAYIFTNDKHNAITYLAKFSKLTRMILEMSGQTTIRLEDELKSINLYLQLEQMRFQSDFIFEINVAPELDVNELRIPAMLIQPYIENAVKHGLLHKEGDKKVSISFRDLTKYIEVVITDNGIGRVKSEAINRQKIDKPKSFSTESNQMRLDLINQDIDAVSVKFIDLYDEHQQAIGTTVIVLISKEYHGY